MAGSLTQLSAHRYSRVLVEIETARLLFDNGSYRSSLNRSYYALFHAIRAVNALDGFDSSKHSGVIAHFNQYYVKTGRFESSVSSIIRHASVMREQADYDDYFAATSEDAAECLEKSSVFIDAVGKFLQGSDIITQSEARQ